MPAIELKDIRNYACHRINLKVYSNELLVLLGPNGAGKTTLLNVIAGLTDYEGSVLFEGTRVDGIPPQKRGVGYLFQELLLFPHLTVASNIAFSLISHGWTEERREDRVREMLDLMRIEHLSSRYPRYLSGGEKQRVALARALAPSPKILLLDEPLSSLDLQAAKYLRAELKHLQRSLGITTVYVTHEFTEAEEMGDRISVIQQGCVEQVGRAEQVFFYPANEKVASFIGAPNILQCDHTRYLGQGLVEVTCGKLSILIPHDGEDVQRVSFFPRDVYVSPMKPPGPEVNRFKGIISDIQTSWELVRLTLAVKGTKILAEMPRYIFESMGLDKAQEVFLILKLRRIKVYEKKKEQSQN
jgi:ABC-type Fe3+/spermidine/putrescine transport system ATPase subunit